MRKSFLAALVLVTACGAPDLSTVNGLGAGGAAGGGTGGAAGGGSGGAGGGSAAGGGTGGAAGAATLSVAECQTDMGRFEAANCADKATWTTAKDTVCPKILNV